ncbi:MAG: mannitol dehydrogenase family protein [Clostridiales bacterium]|nr:mannitol dehydrogenase family protein [Clostridiales bacterium]
MRLSLNDLSDKNAWAAAGIGLPAYNVADAAARARNAPIWVHFGAGNIFRGFIAGLQQSLLNKGLADRGIIAAETFDFDIIDSIYRPCDNLVMNVTLNSDASVDCEIIASIAEAIRADGAGMARLTEIFSQPDLRLVSFTITEKGYVLRGADGGLLPAAEADMRAGPDKPRHAMGVAAALLYGRYAAGKLPLALVSMDNCSHNGEKLRAGVLEIAKGWIGNGFVDERFLKYLSDERVVSFPWSMIDKITPRPDKFIEMMLKNKGVEGMESIITSGSTFIAPFVNAERPQYLIIEDSFPNGRPPLEHAGVYLTDRETVEKTERMKVTACLNPLHTAMAVYGCLLGYERVSEEMKDPEITALIKRLGYTECLPVVTDPGIISPKAFIDEVINKRLPNPFIPDAPRRIASDTSQKVGIRFGETIKSYIAEGRDLSGLVAVPLAIAGWLRYLLGVDDAGKTMDISPDPMKDELTARLKTVAWNEADSYNGQILSILSNARIFGSDLLQNVLGRRVEAYFQSMLNGPGAVRQTLKKALMNVFDA